MAATGWKRSFDEPIPLPHGRRLVTLEDAGNYITKLPTTEHEAAEWQAAFARIGVMMELKRCVARVFTERKDHHWGKRKLKRDD